jgi:4-cresol dehydrogenase (hydroxylating)
VVSIVSLCYDKESTKERELARLCYEKLIDQHLSAGYFPYRTGPTSVETIMQRGDAAYNSFLRTLKRAIDPNEIFSPGRYIPKE